MGSPVSPATRILAQQRQMQGNTIRCERCDGEHFYEIKCTKYLGGGYGSVAIQADTTEQEHSVLLCLCGYPVTPKVDAGRRAFGTFETSQKGMQVSIKSAQDIINSADPQATATLIADACASKSVENRVTDLLDRVGTLEGAVLAPQHEAEDQKHKNKKKVTDTDGPTI